MRFLTLPNKILYDLIALTLLLALLLGIGLGSRPYSAPSESRYIEIGREMAESGDFVTPRLNYVKYFEKPPLFYWIQAESTKLLGFDTFDARVPTAGFAILLCLVTYALTRTLYGRKAAWLGALTLGTSLYLFALSRVVLVDMPVSVFIASTLSAFLYSINTPPSTKRTLVIYAMYASAAFAVLSKGLIGAVLPGAVIFLWFACTGRWKLLKELRLITGTLLFLLIAVPWHLLVAMRNPEWAHFYFIHEHFERYLTKEAGRYQPVWFFAVVLVAGFFPWVVFLWQAKAAALKGFWKDRMQDGRPLFLLIWIVFILVFFSLSKSKLIPYILPIFPPLAAMLGRYLAAAWENRSAPGFTAGLVILLVMLLAVAVAPSLALELMDKDNKVAVAMAQGGEELQMLSVAAMISAVILLVVQFQGGRRHVTACMLLVAAVILSLGDQVSAHYNKDSMKDFAELIRVAHRPGDETAMYQIYYQDMPLYLKQRITLADWKGELEFGNAHEDDSAWMLGNDEFWKRWMKDDHRMFLVMREDIFTRLTAANTPEKLHLYLLQQNGRNLLFMNHLPTAQELKPEKAKP